MWVQEGSDCKDSEDELSRIRSSVLSRGLYNFIKPKATVSTQGIRMMPPSPKPSPENPKNELSLSTPTAEEKEVETDQESELEGSPELPLSFARASSRPITPAKFLENMSRRKEPEPRDGDVPVFAFGENSTDDKGDDFDDLDAEQINDISTMFELDCDGVEVEDLNPESGDSTNERPDLFVIGTKMAISQSVDLSEDEETEEEEPAAGTNQGAVTVVEDDLTVDADQNPEQEPNQKSLTEYIPQKFKGLDVKQWSEWTETMDFSKQNGLVVVELYSVVFGPSEAMYPFIEDLVRLQADRVRFVRLSLHTMTTMEVVHEAIVDHKDYYPSPLPTFLLIRKGKKVGQLMGTKPAELGTLIEKHLTMQQRAATVPVSPVSQKYTSILQRKPRKQTSSSLFQTPRKQTVLVVERGEENIRNLLRRSTGSAPSKSASPTKLWREEDVEVEDEMLLVD